MRTRCKNRDERVKTRAGRTHLLVVQRLTAHFDTKLLDWLSLYTILCGRKLSLSLCVCVLTRMIEIITTACTETCNHAHTDLLINQKSTQSDIVYCLYRLSCLYSMCCQLGVTGHGLLVVILANSV